MTGHIRPLHYILNKYEGVRVVGVPVGVWVVQKVFKKELSDFRIVLISK